MGKLTSPQKQWNRLHDLFNNEEFLAKVKRIQALPRYPFVVGTGTYEGQISELLSRFHLHTHAERAVRQFIEGKPREEVLDAAWGRLELCVIQDNYRNDHPETKYYESEGELYTEEEEPPLPNDPYSGSEHFPLSIGISPTARQSDVIDYIKQNWDSEIRPLLDQYGKQRKKGSREDQKAADFLANRKGQLSISEANKQLKEKLGINISYKEASDLQRAELDRRRQPADNI